ncbi:MAG TPA: thioredoxin domain-containing protein, partial [Oscillatoriaceae cyanobacterium]
LGEATLAHALGDLKRRYDPQWGGFGGAPKFPPSMTLELLLRLATRQHDEAARAMLEHTLVQMARGGLYDHLGGGFHRYSVDREWLVPHFEKMLYDNALLSRIYTLAHVVTGDALYRVVACETLDYVARELTGPHGGFYATQDADSEGEEGNFFVWTLAELEEILGPEARLFAAVFGVSAHGNFEGSNVLHLARAPKEVAESEGVPLEAVQTAVANGRAALFAARAKRVAPGRDEKIVAAWNGMMLKSFAEAARALDHADYRAIAERNADFLLGTLVRDGQLSRIHKDGETKIPGFLEDYANVIDGLLALYEATLTPRWIEAALALTETMLAEFWDANEQAFYDTGKSHEALFTRPRDLFDNAVPAGNSVAIDVLLRLARLTDDARWRGVAESALASIGEYLERYPTGMGRALCALDFHLMPGQEIVLAGAPDAPAMAALRRIVFAGYHPYAIVAGGDDEAMHALEKRLPLLRERAGAPKPLVYVCSGHACLPPIETPSDLRAALALQQKR